MGRVVPPPAIRGSQMWLQRYVRDCPDVLDDAIRAASGDRIAAPIQWMSPVDWDGYAEYRDHAFLDVLGVKLPARSLDSFWPRNGPQWDGLAVTAAGDRILVEAKAHVDEMVTSTSASPVSLERIRGALAETHGFLRARPGADWTTGFYQYANRLAHLYLLRVLNGVPAWLVFVDFVGDREIGGPDTAAEWEAATKVLHAALGIAGCRSPLMSHVLHVPLEVSRVPAI
jgi:hypothetical protein